MKHTESPIKSPQECLNCGTVLSDRYCPHCGQDSKEFRRSVWQVAGQFFETFTELDSTFLRSFFPLLFRPGFLTRQFLAGKRKSFLNPIQMYAFFSFFLFFTDFSFPDFLQNESEISIGKEIENNLYAADSGKVKEVKTNVTIGFPGLKIKVQDTSKTGPIELEKSVKTLKAYDSLQKIIPEKNRDGFFKRTFNRKLLTINEKMQKKETGLFDAWLDTFKSNIPNLLILLLPCFALLLKLLYVRRKWYYVEHLIFGIHFHCFIFFWVSFGIVLSRCTVLEEDIEPYLVLWMFVYFLLALKNVYRQGWIKTFIKSLVLLFSYAVFMAFGLVANLLISALLLEN